MTMMDRRGPIGNNPVVPEDGEPEDTDVSWEGATWDEVEVPLLEKREDWHVEVTVGMPDGRRVVEEGWFPEDTMNARQVGEFLAQVADQVKNRMNSLP